MNFYPLRRSTNDPQDLVDSIRSKIGTGKDLGPALTALERHPNIHAYVPEMLEFAIQLQLSNPQPNSERELQRDRFIALLRLALTHPPKRHENIRHECRQSVSRLIESLYELKHAIMFSSTELGKLFCYPLLVPCSRSGWRDSLLDLELGDTTRNSLALLKPILPRQVQYEGSQLPTLQYAAVRYPEGFHQSVVYLCRFLPYDESVARNIDQQLSSMLRSTRLRNDFYTNPTLLNHLFYIWSCAYDGEHSTHYAPNENVLNIVSRVEPHKIQQMACKLLKLVAPTQRFALPELEDCCEDLFDVVQSKGIEGAEAYIDLLLRLREDQEQAPKSQHIEILQLFFFSQRTLGGVSIVREAYKRKKSGGNGIIDAELMLSLKKPISNPYQSQEIVDVLLHTSSPTFGYEPLNQNGINNLASIGLVSQDFNRYKYDGKAAGGETLFERAGFNAITDKKIGKRYVMGVDTHVHEDTPSPFRPLLQDGWYIEFSHKFFVIAHKDEGLLVVRNSLIGNPNLQGLRSEFGSTARWWHPETTAKDFHRSIGYDLHSLITKRPSFDILQTVERRKICQVSSVTKLCATMENFRIAYHRWKFDTQAAWVDGEHGKRCVGLHYSEGFKSFIDHIAGLSLMERVGFSLTSLENPWANVDWNDSGHVYDKADTEQIFALTPDRIKALIQFADENASQPTLNALGILQLLQKANHSYADLKLVKRI